MIGLRDRTRFEFVIMCPDGALADGTRVTAMRRSSSIKTLKSEERGVQRWKRNPVLGSRSKDLYFSLTGHHLRCSPIIYDLRTPQCCCTNHRNAQIPREPSVGHENKLGLYFGSLPHEVTRCLTPRLKSRKLWEKLLSPWECSDSLSPGSTGLEAVRCS